MPEFDRVVNADCIEWLSRRGEAWVDLVFADPPFNIGYQYDLYEDRKAYDDYYEWTQRWMAACCRALTPTGTLWIAIGDDYAAEVRLIGRELGLYLRNWVIWHYTFGQNTKRKFARAHTHLFYFTKDPAEFTFNDRAVRTFSDRQRIYKDKRANKAGRLPDDVWNEFPRVCGTFAERQGWHPCQMPVAVLSRIIRASSNVGDLVCDPFAGSGTTLVAAKRLSRRYLGIELSENYVENATQRLASVRPIAEARTLLGKWPDEHVEELQTLYQEQGVSISELDRHSRLMECLTGHFNHRLAESGDDRTYEPAEIGMCLEQLARQNRLPIIKVHARDGVSFRRVDSAPGPRSSRVASRD